MLLLEPPEIIWTRNKKPSRKIIKGFDSDLYFMISQGGKAIYPTPGNNKKKDHSTKVNDDKDMDFYIDIDINPYNYIKRKLTKFLYSCLKRN